MNVKVLSVRQPWANLIVHGIKDIENRTWKTNFRGRVYIHAPLKDDTRSIIFTEDQFTCMRDNGYKFNLTPKETMAIIGYIDIVDCIQDSESIWAEDGCYHWVLENPVLLDKPILNVKGKLSFWNYDLVA